MLDFEVVCTVIMGGFWLSFKLSNFLEFHGKSWIILVFKCLLVAVYTFCVSMQNCLVKSF